MLDLRPGLQDLTLTVATGGPVSPAIEEFFELFKIPVRYRAAGTQASQIALVPATGGHEAPDAKVVICYGSAESALDKRLGLGRVPILRPGAITDGTRNIHIDGRLAAFHGRCDEVLARNVDHEPVAVLVKQEARVYVRLGYDLFDEVEQLLTEGQPAERALTPALEIHIDILREALLACGVPVVEIAAHPANHPFTVCLTHDIDFMGIRHHGVDHAFLGFVARVARSLVQRPRRWNLIRRNLKALVSVPAIHLGLARDFWYPMNRYSAVEQGHTSTYFFIPFARRPGQHSVGRRRGTLRGVAYDVTKYAADLRRLEDEGREVAVHGIDAWCDAQAGRVEREVIGRITAREQRGIRMHWLYFSDASVRTLEDAGYDYDSTLGYNDAVGFRNGTTQVFRPTGATRLLELPLNIQDTALFYPRRMNLGEREALERCRAIIAYCSRFGGVVTVNWHDRSLAPERNWDGFYRALLNELEAGTPWFAQARQAVAWFRRRRSIGFDAVSLAGSRVTVRTRPTARDDEGAGDDLPALCLRVLIPSAAPGEVGASSRGRSIELRVSNDDCSTTVDLSRARA
jgi:hypothetical protein